jgi:hypothetical protein
LVFSAPKARNSQHVLTRAGLGILFLPVFPYCAGGGDGQDLCGGRSYIEQGGSALGYIVLILMTLAGASVVASAYDTNRPRVLRVRRVAFLLSLFVVVITIFSIGLAFDPGTVLLLFVAARTARRSPARGV